MDRKFIGFGRTAFSRIIPSFFFKEYGAICYQKSSEDIQLKKLFPFLYFPKNWKKISDFLAAINTSGWLIPYKPTEQLEKSCQDAGWQMVANKTSLRRFFENKKNFREILAKIGIEPIEGENLFIKDLSWQIVQNFQEKYGKKIVLQLPEAKGGGGAGTFFIRTKGDFGRFLKKTHEKSFKFVNILRFIKGIPVCVYGCVTLKGVLTSRLYAVAIDVRETLPVGRKDGVYCGHDFSFFNNSSGINQKASLLVKKIGRFLAKKNYKGIFGIDFIVNLKEGKFYPNECNPRYVDGFPVISFFQMKKGITPFDFYHCKSFLDNEFEFDFQRADENLKTKIIASQIILRNREKTKVQVSGDLKTGVYRFRDGKVELIDKRFIVFNLPDGPFWKQNDKGIYFLPAEIPKKRQNVKKGARMGRIIFPTGCLDKRGKLKDEYRQIVNLVYKKLNLKQSL